MRVVHILFIALQLHIIDSLSLSDMAEIDKFQIKNELH